MVIPMSASQTLSVMMYFQMEFFVLLSYFIASHPIATSRTIGRMLCDFSWFHDFVSVGVNTRMFQREEGLHYQNGWQLALFFRLKKRAEGF